MIWSSPRPRLPLAQVWSTRSVEGVHRFLARTWRACEAGVGHDTPTKEQLRTLHATIRKVRPIGA